MDHGLKIAKSIIYCKTAKEIWDELEQRYGKANGLKIFQLEKEIGSLTQGSQSVATYFAKFKSLWDQYSCLVNVPPCTCASSKAMEELLQNQKLM